MKKLRFSLTKTAFPGTGENLIYFVFSDTIEHDDNVAKLNSLAKGKIFSRMEQMKFQGKDSEILSFDVDGGYDQIVLMGCGESENFTFPVFADRLADAIRFLNAKRSTSATVFVSKDWNFDAEKLGEGIALAAHLANYHFSKYKSHEITEGPSELQEVIVGLEASLSTSEIERKIKSGFSKGELIASGVMFTRDLVNEPASHIYPRTFADEARKIAKDSNGTVTVKVMGQKECETMGMGAYLGVAQGSDNEPQFIVMHYKQKDNKQKKKKLCLIGKSVTFDTGGYQVKPDTFMDDMKIDMGGGATMLGVFKILSHWDQKKDGELPYDIYALMPACENMISGRAFRPGDVLTAMNGKTIEVGHTDAEGRLTLADALSYAKLELKADIAIDFATLTGAVMVALGNEIAGLFGNDDDLIQAFLAKSREEGEDTWQLPLPDKYRGHIKGLVADINNIGSKGRYGGAITAALFLSEFAKDMRWIHLDIAGVAYNEDKPKGLWNKGGTGWGVRTLIQVVTSNL